MDNRLTIAPEERLEVELRPKLEDSRIKGAGDLAEVAGTKPVADLIEFGMVPDIKAFRTKFEPAPRFSLKVETLEERQIPVVTPGAAQRVVPSVAPSRRSPG